MSRGPAGAESPYIHRLQFSVRGVLVAYMACFALLLLAGVWFFHDLVPLLGDYHMHMLLLFVLLIFLLAIALGVLAARQITDPIVRLSRQAGELAHGDQGMVFQSHSYREVSELADALNMARQELNEADELRQELVAALSHDLRTPLTMIMGYAEAIRDLPGEDTPENIQVILDEATRLATLVEDVMERSKREVPLTDLHVTRFDYGARLRKGVARYGAFVASSGVVVEYCAPKHLHVWADQLKLARVVYNLLSNAVEHGGGRGPISVTCTQEGDRVITRIQDYGRGIPEGEHQRIWNMYYSYSEPEGKVHVGLGLAIVRRIMDQHGMPYGVDSIPGEGSTFWFALPVG